MDYCRHQELCRTLSLQPWVWTRVGSVSLSIPHPNPDIVFHLHVEDCLLVPILPTVPDRQGVIAPL